MYLISQCHVAVGVIQSIPIFDETKLFSIPLPKAVGTSVSFSSVLYVYLVVMFLGKSPDKTLIMYIFEQILCSNISLFLFWYDPFGFLPPPQDFLSTFVIFTSRGRGVSAPRRGKQIEIEHQQHSSNTSAACLFLEIFFKPVKPALVFVRKKLFFFSTVCLLTLKYKLIYGHHEHPTDDAIFHHCHWLISLRCKFTEY